MKTFYKFLFRQICVTTCFSSLMLLLIISAANSQPTSIFTRIPSDVAGNVGIIVQIDVPITARYENAGAPIAIYTPGGFDGEGIGDKTGNLPAEGFIEIRYNFQGSGEGQYISGGVYDHRGPKSLKALRDVIMFALGTLKNINGKNISDLVSPIIPLYSNVGLIGWSYGGVTNICVAGVYGDEISNLAWIVNWESPVGDGMPTCEAGSNQSTLRPNSLEHNPAYNPDTGAWDLTSLAYDNSIRIPVLESEDEVIGGLYFDFDGDGKVDLGSDFIAYPLVFEINNGYRAFYSERLVKEATDNNIFPLNPPQHIMSLAETESFWEKRNGEYWIAEAVQKIPQLLFLVCASEIGHVQTVLDHPQVLIQYEGFRNEGARFVRLNPDRSYIEYIMMHPEPTAVDNDAFVLFDHLTIRNAVAPGDRWSEMGRALIPSAACELADRSQFGNVAAQLDVVINPLIKISLSTSSLNFGSTTSGTWTADQQFRISCIGDGSLDWSISDNATWLSCASASGTGNAVITVSVDPSGLSSSTYNGTITVSSPNASNSPQTISVTLNVYAAGTSSGPLGVFATPVDGSTVSSSIPVTGWALDDIGVESVKIYRGDGVYIGDALFVEGARPDVEQNYPTYPNNYKAGWGYMLLTNFLPNGGNGTFTIYAIATDKEGNEVTLGASTITVDNANAVKPFGAIDTPAQGGTASGSSFVNFGWTLTPMPNEIPKDGSTLDVYVDGVNIGHPVYNQYRPDVAALFPGYANSDGAVGYFYLNTTAYTDGVHTIAWTAKDNAGNMDGIGSRYFSVQNSGSSINIQMQGGIQRKAFETPLSFESVMNLPINYDPISYKRGFKTNIEPETAVADNYGVTNIEIREVERIEILLNHELSTISYELSTMNHKPSTISYQPSAMSYSGYMVVGTELRPLPIGSTLNAEAGVFHWLPGPGFVGKYDLVFIKTDKYGMPRKIIFRINIVPKFRLSK